MQELPFLSSEIKSFQDVTVTSKRQVTLPKRFYDALSLRDRTLTAYLTDEGIFLRPVKSSKEKINLDLILDDLLSRNLTKQEFKETLLMVLTDCLSKENE